MLANPRRVNAVDDTSSVALDVYFQSHFDKSSTRFSPFEPHFETVVIVGKVASLRKRSIRNDLTQAIFI